MENILKENIRSSTENQGNNGVSTQKNFRFFDNRQKYLLFVSTCSEKEIISKHVGKEISLLNPSPPAIRVFDAGMGDGTLLASVLRNLHQRFPTLPFYISGKEISLEDVRLCMSTLPQFWSLLIFSTMRPRGLDQKNPVQQIHWYGKSCLWMEIHLMISVSS